MAGFDLSAYLEAKVHVDQGSLNPRLHGRVRGYLRRRRDPVVVDLGTGTGAMLRRLLPSVLAGNPFLVGVDQDGPVLDRAAVRITAHLEAEGFTCRNDPVAGSSGRQFRGRRGPATVRVAMRQDSLPDARTLDDLAGRVDLVCAHTVMDLLPLAPTLGLVRRLLRPGGWFYASCTYDGLTELFPAYRSPGFEQRLLGHYDRSMEERRLRGVATGGAQAGRRLEAVTRDAGLVVTGIGSSDWQVVPGIRPLSAPQRAFLEAIVIMMHGEAANVPRMDSDTELLQWVATRSAQAREGRLGLIAHQLDLCAVLPGGRSR